MTARTHDLAAFTTLTLAVIWIPLPPMTLATVFGAFGANMLGGLFPDLDESTAEFWRKIRGGSVLAKLISPLLGGHRLISHSIVGLILTGWLLSWLLEALSLIILVDMNIIWWAFMLGFISHLIMDSFTKEGIPWFFPFAWKIGWPPFKALRIKTGGIMEKSLIFPGLMLLNGYLIYTNQNRIWQLFHQITSN